MYAVLVVWRCRKIDNCFFVKTPGARCWMSACTRNLMGRGWPTVNKAGNRSASDAVVSASVGSGAAGGGVCSVAGMASCAGAASPAA